MKKIVLIGAVLLIAIPIAYYFINQRNEKKLPIINPCDLLHDVVAPELRNKCRGHRIEDFEFYNQNGNYIKSSEIKGGIWVVEYFFATCKGICPTMNSQLKRVQKAYKDDESVKIMSFTVDPENDTIEALKKYAVEHDAIDGKWHFFTGDRADLYELARKSFFLLKPAEAENLDYAGGDFMHTNNFVLIDSKRRIRGYYDGTNPDEVDELIADIRILQSE